LASFCPFSSSFFSASVSATGKNARTGVGREGRVYDFLALVLDLDAPPRAQVPVLLGAACHAIPALLFWVLGTPGNSQGPEVVKNLMNATNATNMKMMMKMMKMCGGLP
jgi:hypothetical protein